MNISNKIKAAFIALYLAGAFLTGGYYWNHVADQGAIKPELETVIMATIWPVYWAAHLSIIITK